MKPITRRTAACLASIILAYLVLGTLFALVTPAWQAPDEPAHYNYIRHVATVGSFPVLHMGDYPHAYLEEIKEAGFPDGMPVDPIRYESHQPPLYYVLAAPIYTLSGGDLTALRLFSVLLGSGIVLLTYAVARRIHPDREWPALAAAAFVAFLPQHLAALSQVGNDVLAELLFAGVLYILVGWVQSTGRDDAERTQGTRRSLLQSLQLAVLLGLILITKTTVYIALPLAACAAAWRWHRERAGLRRMAIEGSVIILPIILMALPWYARSVWAYGWPDFLGLQRHDDVVVGQMRTIEYIAGNGWGAFWRRAVEWTFKSFWGVFGWMGVWLDSRVYFGMALFTGVVAAGLIADGLPRRSRSTHVPMNRPAVALLGLSALLTLLAYVWYNIQFLQHQGRYLFTALVPIAIACASGWETALRPQASRWLAALLVLFAIGLAAWGVLAGIGLPKWPLALTTTLAAAFALVSLAKAPQATSRAVAIPLPMIPFALMPLLDLYALYGAIMPQLTR